jgi:methionine synthase reductase
VKIDLTSKTALIVVASTTGDGDPPDNATKFMRWLRRAKKPELDAAFLGRPYAILGLGDTNYTNFCQTAKRLDRRFTELGAVPFVPKGLADDGTG